jgi:hypothetical protein
MSFGSAQDDNLSVEASGGRVKVRETDLLMRFDEVGLGGGAGRTGVSAFGAFLYRINTTSSAA